MFSAVKAEAKLRPVGDLARSPRASASRFAKRSRSSERKELQSSSFAAHRLQVSYCRAHKIQIRNGYARGCACHNATYATATQISPRFIVPTHRERAEANRIVAVQNSRSSRNPPAPAQNASPEI